MKITKFFVLLMAVTVLILAVGCSRSESATGSQTQSPITITMGVRMHQSDTPPDLNAPFAKLLAERTGVRIDAQYWPEVNIMEMMNVTLASGQIPDLMYVTPEMAHIYGAEGIFDPLNTLLDRNAPNISRNITPDNVVALKAPNGNIYHVPKFDDRLVNFYFRTYDYRYDILNEMGEKEPATLEEWYQLFKKVKARYPDVIPLVERSRRINDFVHTAFDMGMMINDIFGIIGSDFAKRQIVFLPTTNEWRDMLQYYARLYAEDLLDHEYLTIPYDTWWEGKIGAGRAFACWTMNGSRAAQANELAWRAGFTNIQWGVARTIQNYKTGQSVQYAINNPWDERGGYALSSKSKVKEQAVKFMDFFFSDEYINYVAATSFNGVSRYSLTGADWDKLIGVAGFFYYPKTESIVVPFETIPPLNVFGQPAATYDHDIKNIDVPGGLIGIPTVTVPSSDRWATLSTDLRSYIETAMDEFITGRRSFAQWDAYVAETKRIGADSAVADVQASYNEYWRVYDMR
jgi:putative aldouronate transport system substrate-binding protein